MKLYIYRGIDGEEVPKDVTHAIIEESVTIIRSKAFWARECLVSVIMSDNVTRIEQWAFRACITLRFIRLSKALKYIEGRAFIACYALEAIFLPSAIKSIEYKAFFGCAFLKLLVLPNDVEPRSHGNKIFYATAISNTIAETIGVRYVPQDRPRDDSNDQINEWLIHYMDQSPLHRLCYESSITTQKINQHLIENASDSLAIDSIHGMTPLHMLAMNPFASADCLSALLDSRMEAIFRLDDNQKTPLDCARNYNVGGLVGMIVGLCNYRNSSIVLVERDAHHE